MKANSRKYIIDDIAKRSGVSVSTVSRVLNKRPYVKDRVRKKVLEVASKMNYDPKVTARRDNIAIVSAGIPDLYPGSFSGLIISSIVKSAMERQMKVEIVPISDVDIVFENFVRAVIGIVFGKEDLERLASIKNVPIMTVNNILDGCHYVCTDHFESTRIATDNLIKKGHTRIALFIAPRAGNLNWGSAERVNGYKQALLDNGIPFSDDLVLFDGSRIMENLAKAIMTKRVSALIAGGESASMPIWHSLRLLDKKIPDEMSVVLFDTPGITPYLFPAPTVIRQDFDLLGRTVVDGVLGLLDGSVEKVNKMLPVEFIGGDSIKDLNRTRGI